MDANQFISLSSKSLNLLEANAALIDILGSWGISHFCGVTGGGLIQILKYIETYQPEAHNLPSLLIASEYVAGFFPIGYHLATGGIAATVATTGAATKLISSGISDAKYQNIPALYLIAVNATSNINDQPIQDVSPLGMNIFPQLKAELGDGCILIDSIESLPQKISQVRYILTQSRPVALLFRPDVLSQRIDLSKISRDHIQVGGIIEDKLDIAIFETTIHRRRAIILVTDEAARYPDMPELTTQLAEILQAPTIWTVNGANGISRDNAFGRGHIMFGGNDPATSLWLSLGTDDVVISLGFEPGEYALNLGRIPGNNAWLFTNFSKAYGQQADGFSSRFEGKCHEVRGSISKQLKRLIEGLKYKELKRAACLQIDSRNTVGIRNTTQSGCVDLVELYRHLDTLWQPNSIGFDDVCVAYRDRQSIIDRPNPNIRFYNLSQGSAMGGAFGLGLGAKLADFSQQVFIFSGDGCWRLYGGALADAANLALRVFLLNNGTYGIVEQGLKVLLPTTPSTRIHARLPSIDFVNAAESHGWIGVRLDANLGNLESILDICYTKNTQSILIEVPVDPNQVVGKNTRLLNLKRQTYL
jgi:acetolactate synthase-1/2/3 large subunit